MTNEPSSHGKAPADHSDGQRLASLDGLRGIAALVVALHHLFFHFAPWPYPPAPLAHVLGWIAASGWTLVDLFFLLSGYVFAHVYLSSGVLETAQGRADFLIARFARLYPLHLAVLLLFAVIHPQNPYNTLSAFGGHLVMMQAFIAYPAASFDYAAWSLSVEVACYAIFLAAAMAGRRVLLAATILFAALGLIQLVVWGSVDDPVTQDLLRRGLLGFFTGQLMWHGRAWLLKLPAALLIAAFAAGLWLQVRGGIPPMLPLTLLAWPAALLLVLRWGWFGSRPLLWLGDRSYAIYLLNMAVIVFVIADLKLKPGALAAPARAALELVMIAAILGLSDLSYRWLERPARRAIRQAWDRRAAGRQSAVPATA